eukprot:512109-Prorocentrum_minimum.AAC.5
MDSARVAVESPRSVRTPPPLMWVLSVGRRMASARSDGAGAVPRVRVGARDTCGASWVGMPQCEQWEGAWGEDKEGGRGTRTRRSWRLGGGRGRHPLPRVGGELEVGECIQLELPLDALSRVLHAKQAACRTQALPPTPTTPGAGRRGGAGAGAGRWGGRRSLAGLGFPGQVVANAALQPSSHGTRSPGAPRFSWDCNSKLLFHRKVRGNVRPEEWLVQVVVAGRGVLSRGGM